MGDQHIHQQLCPENTASVLRDGGGNVEERIWRNPDGSTNRLQQFDWDAKDRLTDYSDFQHGTQNGIHWHAEYDGLNRRLFTTCTVITNGQDPNLSPLTINQYYDPQVEFLELGVSYGNTTEWKLYGPDLNGVYGGLNGTGGHRLRLFAVSEFVQSSNQRLSRQHLGRSDERRGSGMESRASDRLWRGVWLPPCGACLRRGRGSIIGVARTVGGHHRLL